MVGQTQHFGWKFESKICSETSALDKMPWRVFRDDVQILDEEQVKSVVSLNSASTKMSQVETKLIKNHAIVGVNTHAVYDLYEQRQNIRFTREDLILLTKVDCLCLLYLTFVGFFGGLDFFRGTIKNLSTLIEVHHMYIRISC